MIAWINTNNKVSLPVLPYHDQNYSIVVLSYDVDGSDKYIEFSSCWAYMYVNVNLFQLHDIQAMTVNIHQFQPATASLNHSH